MAHRHLCSTVPHRIFSSGVERACFRDGESVASEGAEAVRPAKSWPHGVAQGAQEWRERGRGRCADRRTLPLLEVLVELSRMANYIFISKSGNLSIEFM